VNRHIEGLGFLRLPLEIVTRASQLAVARLQPVGHDVEDVSELADLVAEADPDPGIEVGLGHAPGGSGQLSQRGGDPAIDGHARSADEPGGDEDEGHVEHDDGADQALAALEEPLDP
jgi:hypothetical protein